jgi:hypothetical protein
MCFVCLFEAFLSSDRTSEGHRQAVSAIGSTIGCNCGVVVVGRLVGCSQGEVNPGLAKLGFCTNYINFEPRSS